MSTERFVRWQGYTMAHLTATHALLMGLSVGGLGLLFSLASNAKWTAAGGPACLYLWAIGLLIISALAGLGVMVTRLLDFRLTAKKVRAGEAEEPLTMFGSSAHAYGKATWGLFWTQLLSFVCGVSSGAVAIGKAYLGDIIQAAAS